VKKFILFLLTKNKNKPLPFILADWRQSMLITRSGLQRAQFWRLFHGLDSTVLVFHECW
jgi:hypothetical protein